jgi:hypothetical protein
MASVRIVRAAAHIHSEWSDDAAWPLSRIASTFARRGCDVLLMSEHSRGFSQAKWDEYVDACADASSSGITVVPGIEYGDADDVVHIPVWGRVPFFGESPDISALLASVVEAGGTAVLAHPWRRDAWRRIEPVWSKHLDAIEVWNRKYDGICANRRSVELSRSLGIEPFAALDFHTRRQLFPLSVAIKLQQAAIDPPGHHQSVAKADEIYDALQAGAFSCQAFGLPLHFLARGWPASLLRVLEYGRRTAARVVHT